ncbi:serine/threonine-protein kinase [Acidovorax sp. SUPP3334]|uniref:serine/threonine protein kinase n=1 Tax=Acidovorax sp. SUPP3334 TaxID=2920881 RepID=UPI0023DE5B92|nr:serine/threonine-protein kinase [Acidovorax sp. SUPP3334]GKT22099.1 serine/threonine protein kinase [Acidovorax sp. SUPP3334]
MSATTSTEPPNDVHHVDALPAGTRLGEFEVLSLLGVGGFGMVYKAFDHSLLRFVAIKEYMPSALAARAQGQSLWVRSSSQEQSFQAGLASFVSEARLLAQFDHPSLVKVFRFWEANHTAYMVMPLYTGMTFKQARAHMRTPPPEAWLRKLLWSVLSALRVLHDGQTLHRDISPDNIFLQDSGPPVLLDLGAARHAISDQGHQHTAVLKVNYAPIEQYSDSESDLRQGPWSDLYALGAVVHGSLCNDTPLPATLRSIRDRMVPFSRVAKTVRRQFGVEYSPSFVAAISQALALRPDERPQSIDEFLRTMEMVTPPEGIDQFDFRAELGDVWVEPADRHGTGVAVPMIDITSVPAPAVGTALATPMAATVAQPMAEAPTQLHIHRQEAGDTVVSDMQDTVFMDSKQEAGDSVMVDTVAGETVFEERRPQHPERLGRGKTRRAQTPGGDEPPAPAVTARRRPLAWAGAGMLAVAVIAAGLWWGVPRETSHPTKYTPEDQIITELAEPPMAAVSAPAAELVAVVDEAAPVAQPAASSASTAAAAAPAFVVASAPRPRPVPRKVAEPLPQAVAAEAPPAPEPPPTVAPKPVAVRVAGPDEACANAGFLARPMCIHQQCQNSAVANHPLCVENRRRLEAEERRRTMLSQ